MQFLSTLISGCDEVPLADCQSDVSGHLRRARRYEMKLWKAVAIAARRNPSGDSRLAALYAGAKVEGVDSKLRMVAS